MRPLFSSTVRLPVSEGDVTALVTSSAITSATETTAIAITDRLATCPSGKVSLQNVGIFLAAAVIDGRVAMAQKSPKASAVALIKAVP